MNNIIYQVYKECVLQKFSGKGGWVYVEVPEIAQSENSPFGWVKVKGFIDSFKLNQYKLMPMGDGTLFLPVKASVRKLIGKSVGDTICVKLSVDDSEYIIPEEIYLCFENEPEITYINFKNFTEGERKAYIDWIYSAKQEETIVNRIVSMMKRVFYDKKLSDKE